MSDETERYGRSGLAGPLVVVSLLLVAGLVTTLFFLVRQSVDEEGETIVVHCAAGIRKPVEEAARAYEEEYGVIVRLLYDNSGGLLNSISLRPEGDLYVPADSDFVARGRAKGLLAESIPLARFSLVVAVKKGNPRGIRSIDDLLRDDVAFAICNPQAGAGAMTRRVLTSAAYWQRIDDAKRTAIPTVTNAATSVESSSALDAAIIWDSTARQYGLEIVELPELAAGVANIEVAVLTATEDSARALRFARWLSAPEKGGALFEKHHYDPVPGDAWEAQPVISVFAGGVNRDAVMETFREFEEREGCRIQANYGGCGTLVGQIETSPTAPDFFLTCDASYMDMVSDVFLTASDVSETPIVILSRSGDERVSGLEDLARPGLSLGITEPRASALGALSVRLLEQAGLWERVRPNVKVHSPTAHELRLQMETSGKLDAALLYEANCQGLGDEFEMLRIGHPLAKAVQNAAPGRETEFPLLVGRLIDALLSARSKSRFESRGFSWRAGVKEAADASP